MPRKLPFVTASKLSGEVAPEVWRDFAQRSGIGVDDVGARMRFNEAISRAITARLGEETAPEFRATKQKLLELAHAQRARAKRFRDALKNFPPMLGLPTNSGLTENGEQQALRLTADVMRRSEAAFNEAAERIWIAAEESERAAEAAEAEAREISDEYSKAGRPSQEEANYPELRLFVDIAALLQGRDIRITAGWEAASDYEFALQASPVSSACMLALDALVDGLCVLAEAGEPGAGLAADKARKVATQAPITRHRMVQKAISHLNSATGPRVKRRKIKP